MTPTTYCRAAVFERAGRPLRIRRFPLPDTLEPRSVLCRVTLSTICGSDLHTVAGRREEPTPLILGHEGVGRIVTLGDDVACDQSGNALHPGDRITWSIMTQCADCFYCRRGLPQKCEHLCKYGHTCCTDPPHVTGGYAEYICLLPGTAIFKLPDMLSDDMAAPANCALSTSINAVEAIGLDRKETVLVQGAGLLGLNLVSLAREMRAGTIMVTDPNEKRLALASEFGADHCINPRALTEKQIVRDIITHSGGYGVDVAFEVCGAQAAVVQAVKALRAGGRYLIAGLVMPGPALAIEGNQVTRKCLTIKGVHNYTPPHLDQAIRFLTNCHAKYPYRQLVGKTFSLTEINKAMRAAASGEYVRVGVTPT